MGESTQLLMCHVMHLYLQRSICLFKELDIHPGQAGLLWALNCKDQDHRGMAQKELAKRSRSQRHGTKGTGKTYRCKASFDYRNVKEVGSGSVYREEAG